jgi:hypothetical protein
MSEHDGITTKILATELEDIVRQSYDNWSEVSCAQGGTPNISVETYPQVECSEVRYNKTDANQNLWVFRDKVWPHDDPAGLTIALTSVIFNPETGEIYDADVELNSSAYVFGLETVSGGTDLQSVVQHESGHVLGLAHSDTSSATMWTNYSGNSSMRTLKTDDAEGLCATYPPTTKTDQACDAEPRHGFATTCTTSKNDGCSVGRAAGSSRSRSSAYWLAALGLLVVTTRRLRRHAS